MAHCFIEVDKAVIQVISFVGFLECGFHSFSPLMDEDKRFMEAS